MRQFLLAAGILAAYVPSVQAFEVAECGEIESQIYTLLNAEFGWDVTQSPTSTAEAFADGCAVSNLDLHVQDIGVHYTIGSARMIAGEAMDWVRGDVVLPGEAALVIEDVALNEDFGVPADLAYLSDVSAQVITLNTRWDGVEQTLDIEALRIDLGDDNVVTVEMNGQARDWQPYVMRAEDFGLTRLGLAVSFNGLFEQAIAPPIEANGTALTPESAQFLSAMAFGLMANVPPTLLPMQSQEAIVDFLATIPNPRGDLSLVLRNEEPFSPEQIAQDVIGGQSLLEAVPEALTLDADWAPAQ
ncbi:hypothetical protein [Gymnodinialimonas ulvae]|uniref:hypothetical protein n=1 Tax=Gymnodinialimonas ulvae TaxID=3126504 RepID=UPI00309F4433